MAYQPKVGDTVRIENYTGMLHPLTEFDIIEVRSTICKIGVVGRDSRGLLSFTKEMWVETERLVHIKKTPKRNDPDVSRA